MRLWLDLETYSLHDLKVVGVHRYCELGTEIRLFGWAIDDEPARVWQVEHEPMPERLAEALKSADTLVAHNAPFDRNVLEYLDFVERSLTRWRCSQAQALTLSLPGALGPLCVALDLDMDQRKLRDGKRLVQKFCKPRKPSKTDQSPRWGRHNAAADWDRYVEYCRMDVEAMRECSKLMPWYNFENRVWRMDQDMNDRGFRVDLRLCENAIRVSKLETDRLYAEMTTVTGGAVTKPTQLVPMASWLDSRGLKLPNMTRDTLEEAIDRPGLSHEVRAVLLARLEYSRAAVTKYQTLVAGTNNDSRARGCYQYAGAGQTMRWAGRRFQPQNLFRPLVDCHSAVDTLLDEPEGLQTMHLLWSPVPVLDVIASAVRGCVVAPPGKVLHVWDLSQIEARITFWFAKGAMLAAFADPRRDPYVETAADIGSDSRQLGKALTLACGFGMGGEKFQATARKPPYRLSLTEPQAYEYVRAWRQVNPEVPAFWRDIERMAVEAVWAPPGSGLMHTPTGIKMRCAPIAGRRCLEVTLPSKHRLVYWDIEVGDDRRLTYTRYYSNGGGVPQYPLWGGPIVENIVQATARHILATLMLEVVGADKRLDLVGTVHDEAIMEGDLMMAGEDAVWLQTVFTKAPSWAEGLPLAAEGYIEDRYRK